MPRKPDKTVSLTFNFADPDPEKLEKKVKKVRDNLSAVVLHEKNLWLGVDEKTSLHRLTRDEGNFGTHQSFDLRKFVKLPMDDDGEEIDFEGMDIDSGHLWWTGSHSAKREKPQAEDPVQSLGNMATPTFQGNRFSLGRVPIVQKGADFEPEGKGACLDANARSNSLSRALEADPHLAPFVPGKGPGIPSKDNGLDVEGLAVSGSRVFVGLRGPVLRGCAIILELQIVEDGQNLRLDPVGSSGPLFRKYFLDLRGLGIRDLVIDGKDLLILAGPTMVLDGPVFLYRWRDALGQKSETFVGAKDSNLQKLFSIPCGNEDDLTETKDHAEGLALIKSPLSVLVCYDSPSDRRISGPGRLTVSADIFNL